MFNVALVALIPSSVFGAWQHNWVAGLFMFTFCFYLGLLVEFNDQHRRVIDDYIKNNPD